MKGRERIWFSVIVILLCGCRTVKEDRNIADVRISTNLAGHVVRDSIFVRDSIYVHEKADTVFFTKYRTLYKENVVRDTLYVCDTLYRERVVTEYVSRDGGWGHWWWLLVLLPFFPWMLKWLRNML